MLCLIAHTDVPEEQLTAKLTKMILKNRSWLKKLRDKHHGAYDNEHLQHDFFRLEILSRAESDTYRTIEGLYIPPHEDTYLTVVKIYVNTASNINFIEMCLRKSIKVHLHDSERAELTNNWNYAFSLIMHKEIFRLISKSFDDSFLNGCKFILAGSVADCLSIA